MSTRPLTSEYASAVTRGGKRRSRLIPAIWTLLAAVGVALGVSANRSAPPPAPRLALASSSSQSSAARTTLASPLDPSWIALVNGDLYIADGGRQEILKRSPDGNFSVVAGTGVPGFSGEGGPAADAKIDRPSYLVALGNGSLFFQQAGPHQGSVIREIPASGLIRTVVGLHPSCAGVAASATSMAAESAPISGIALSVGADGSLLLAGAQPCPQAGHLGPFLQLTATGQLADIQLDSSPLINSALVSCGPNVPAHVVEGGEGKREQTVLASPTPYLVDQRSPHAPTLVSRDDAHLFDVRHTVDHVDNDEADHARAGAHGDPCPAGGRVRLEHGGRRGLVIGNGVETDLPEALTRSDLYLAHERGISPDTCSDPHPHRARFAR